jgi:hypothetical protein
MCWLTVDCEMNRLWLAPVKERLAATAQNTSSCRRLMAIVTFDY